LTTRDRQKQTSKAKSSEQQQAQKTFKLTPTKATKEIINKG
jgi:hypothetical protein